MEDLSGQPRICKKMTKQLTGKRGDTPLHSAARAGDLNEVKQIFGRGSEEEMKQLIMKQNQFEETALYVAAEYGSADVVEEMVNKYDTASAGVKARNGYDAFHIAAKQGNLGMHSNLNLQLLKFAFRILTREIMLRRVEGSAQCPPWSLYDC